MTDLQKQIVVLMADHSMSVKAVADDLHYHWNTINWHLHKIIDETGLSPWKFWDLVALLDMLGVNYANRN